MVLTDLAPEQWPACCYGLRAWIEDGFKFTKSEGWQWQRTRMQDPQRVKRLVSNAWCQTLGVKRLWLVLAVATLKVIMSGSQAEDHHCAGTPVTALPAPRRVSPFRCGWVAHLVALWRQNMASLNGKNSL